MYKDPMNLRIYLCKDDRARDKIIWERTQREDPFNRGRREGPLPRWRREDPPIEKEEDPSIGKEEGSFSPQVG